MHVAESQSIWCFVCKMVLSNVIVDVTISCRSFVFGESRAKVSAAFTNVSSLAVEAFDLVYCFLSALPAWGTSETIAHVLQPYNIRVAHKPITTLRRLLTNVKDKDNDDCLTVTVDGSKRTNYKIKLNLLLKIINLIWL